MDLVVRWPVHRLVYAASVGAALLVSTMAFVLLGPVVGIKSAYVLLGLLLSWALFGTCSRADVPESPTQVRVPGPRVLGRVVFVLVVLGVTVVPAARWAGTGVAAARLAVPLLVLPLGYVALVPQLRRESSSGWILAQVVGLFAVTPIVKYQSTGFYAGSGDTPGHVYLVTRIVDTGTWQVIPTESFYHYFPGLHTLFGSTSLLTGLPAYDVYMLAGVATYGVVICVAYLLGRLLFERRVLALFVGLATSLALPVVTHASYFYPQALAVAMGLVLLLASYRGSTDSEGYPRYVGLGVLVVAQLWFTHHLTVVLFVPILLALAVGPVLVTRAWSFRSAGSAATATVRPALLPLAIWVVGSVAYWVWSGVFIDPFVGSVRDVLAGPLIAGTPGGGGGSEVIPVKALGRQLPETSAGTAALSVLSPTGIYSLLLVCTVSFAVVTALSRLDRFRRPMAFIVVGAGGALLLLPTPLVAIGLDRTQLPLSPFVAVVVAIALSRLLLNAATLPRLASVVVVFLLLSTSATVAASDEAYALHSGPDLWEDRPLPEEQVEFSQREMESLEQGSAYLRRHEVGASTDWRTQIGLERYGTDSDSMVVEEGRIGVGEDLLVYRDRWPDHSIRLIPEPLSLVTLVIDEAWLERTVRRENKVYTTGEIGMLSDRGETGTIG